MVRKNFGKTAATKKREKFSVFGDESFYFGTYDQRSCSFQLISYVEDVHRPTSYSQRKDSKNYRDDYAYYDYNQFFHSVCCSCRYLEFL